MKQSTFAERLAYARWILHGESGDAPTNADIARAVGRTAAWVTKWASSDVAPRDYEVHRPMAEFLGASEDWLVRGEGNPPEVALWAWWIAKRRRPTAFSDTPDPPTLRVAESPPPYRGGDQPIMDVPITPFPKSTPDRKRKDAK